jgi:hypothetical protein
MQFQDSQHATAIITPPLSFPTSPPPSQDEILYIAPGLTLIPYAIFVYRTLVLTNDIIYRNTIAAALRKQKAVSAIQ